MSTQLTDLERENQELKSVISKMHVALLSCRTEKTPYGNVQHYDRVKVNKALSESEDIFLENGSSRILSAIETVRFSNKSKAS